MKRIFIETAVLAGIFPASIFVVSSCGGKLGVADKLDIAETPVQVVDNVFAVQTKNSLVSNRLEAPRMERYERDTATLEVFPDGFNVFGYNEEGLLETVITSRVAVHETGKSVDKEMWKAYGNVEIRNVIKQETMQTDTIYWDQVKGEIYTDCYVRMFAPGGFMQGYGMISDDKARESTILKPFNSYGIVVRDTTEVLIDSLNFIGPFPKK